MLQGHQEWQMGQAAGSEGLFYTALQGLEGGRGHTMN